MIKKDIFHFNHINKNISPEKISGIKALYKYYKRKIEMCKFAYTT